MQPTACPELAEGAQAVGKPQKEEPSPGGTKENLWSRNPRLIKEEEPGTARPPVLPIRAKQAEGQSSRVLTILGSPRNLAPRHTAMGEYLYEIIGGLLIVLSSLVGEQMKPEWKYRSYVAFAIIAVTFSLIGVHVRREAAAKDLERKEEISA
jgi:hypothetical protein